MIQNRVRKYLNGKEIVAKWFWLIQIGPKWSRLVQIQYQIYLQVKKMGVTHEKMGFWPQNPDLEWCRGSNAYFITYNIHLFFSDKMPNWIRNLMSKTKIGVIYEKMGIWPQKWWKKGKIDDDELSYHLEWTKTT